MEKKYIIAANIILFLSLLHMYDNSEVEVFKKKSWLANWISIVSVTYIKVLWRNNIGLE